MLGRNGACDGTFFAGVTVIRFAVVAGVGQEMLDGKGISGGFQCFSKLVHINAGAACWQGPEDQMITTIANHAQFGPTPIIGLFVRLDLFGAFSADKVSAGVARFQAGGIHRG